MKKIAIGVIALIGISLSSCFIRIEGRHHRHEAAVELHTSQNGSTDSPQSPAASDSLKTTDTPGVKQ